MRIISELELFQSNVESFLLQVDPFFVKYKDAEVDVASFVKPFLDEIEASE